MHTLIVKPWACRPKKQTTEAGESKQENASRRTGIRLESSFFPYFIQRPIRLFEDEVPVKYCSTVQLWKNVQSSCSSDLIPMPVAEKTFHSPILLKVNCSFVIQLLRQH